MQASFVIARVRGLELPALRLRATTGGLVDLRELAAGLLALYVYPQMAGPDVQLPAAWDRTPGARGCTPQSCGFRDARDRLADLGVAVAGLSAQPHEQQLEAAARLELGFPLLADPDFRLHAELGLPTFSIDGAVFYRRVTLIAHRGRVVKVFYPVDPPAANAEEVLAWLEDRSLTESTILRPWTMSASRRSGPSTASTRAA
jgi:peroxiredoxin